MVNPTGGEAVSEVGAATADFVTKPPVPDSITQRGVAVVGRSLSGFVALAYVLTSLVVVLNATGNATGVVWLPTFPDTYYVISGFMYRPFASYFSILAPIQANPSIDYMTYAWISRAPFLGFPLAWLAVLTFFTTPGVPGTRRRPGGIAALTLAGGLVITLLVSTWAVFRAGVAGVDGLEQVAAFVRRFGAWAPVISFLLMSVQAIPMPIPTVAITLTNGLVYGLWWGALLSWSGAMCASVIGFMLARRLGRPFVKRVAGESALALVDRWSAGNATQAVFVARLIPPVSFRAVSFAAGLTPMPLSRFILATGVGQAPATIAYSAIGSQLVADVSVALWVCGAVGMILVTGATVRRVRASTRRPEGLAVSEANGIGHVGGSEVGQIGNSK
ncbi:MAG: TVP38/TMEM64 family protein [Chloroflexi bacterium]|nr:TVP38/TMEM64 family protein [Chloroflexota bacterium]